MEVTVNSTLSSAPGQITLTTDDNEYINSLIIAFCTDRGIQVQKNYVLRNINHEILPLSKKIGSCNIKDGDLLYLGLKDFNGDWPLGCNPWWLIAGVALLIGGVGIVATSLIRSNSYSHPQEFGVVIDCGSSHSQIFVYRWDASKNNGTAIAKQIFTCKAKGGGISSYEKTPDMAGRSLEECLHNATASVPVLNHSNTSIFLGATAGMRLLNASNIDAANAIMESVRKTLNNSVFWFKYPTRQARIISGSEEGSFGWVTVNYLSGILTGSAAENLYNFLYGREVLPSYGALDMGGASTQITFVPEKSSEIISGYSETLVMYGRKYNVYTHSYLCYGANEAWRRLLAHLVIAQKNETVIKNPCTPQGNVTYEAYSNIFEVPCTLDKIPPTLLTKDDDITYEFHGTSNSEECHSAVEKLFNFTQPCDDPQQCSFNGIYQPNVTGEFMAFSTFFYTASFLNLTTVKDTFSLQSYRDATKNLCGKSWSEISSIPISDANLLIKYCFDGHYIDALLTQGYKFTNETWPNIHFKNNVSDSDVGWTLGLMLNVSNRIPADYPAPTMNTLTFILLLIFFSIFLAVAVAFACHAKRKGKNNSTYVRIGSQYGAI